MGTEVKEFITMENWTESRLEKVEVSLLSQLHCGVEHWESILVLV